MIIIYILILLLGIIAIYLCKKYIIILKPQLKEGYDDRKKDIELEECANVCKTMTGCTSFGYDPKKKICYPSQILLTGRPMKGIHRVAHQETDILCNKISAIQKEESADYKYTPSILKNNSTYICRDHSSKYSGMYLHDNNEFKSIDDVNQIKKLIIDPYKVKFYKWPLNELSNKEINKIVKKNKINEDINAPPTFPKGKQDFSIEDQEVEENISVLERPQFDDEFDEKKAWRGKENVSQDIIKDEEDLSPRYTVFKATKKYNEGDYLKSHKCVNNISLKTCLSYCSNNKMCGGTEWNPYFIQYKGKTADRIHRNVCCPMKTTKLGERELQHDLGNYYTKEKSKELSLSNEYIYNE
jgi:hypothetical protein